MSCSAQITTVSLLEYDAFDTRHTIFQHLLTDVKSSRKREREGSIELSPTSVSKEQTGNSNLNQIFGG